MEQLSSLHHFLKRRIQNAVKTVIYIYLFVQISMLLFFMLNFFLPLSSVVHVKTHMRYKIPNFFYQYHKIKGYFWNSLAHYTKPEIESYLQLIFPDTSNDMNKIEREFFFDKNKKIENEYNDEHTDWPDETYIPETPNHQKIGSDVVPGIKDVQYLIRNHQFPQSCTNKKFMAHSGLYSGFGSINHLLGAILGEAIIRDRIFIWGNQNIIYNNGPYCGKDTNSFQKQYIQKMINRSHTKIPRPQQYYTGAYKPEGFDCFFEPITNCTVNLSDADIVYFQPSDNHIVPDMIKPIISQLKIPDDLSYYYWRLCATAFFYRENEVAKQWVRELEEDYLVNPVDHYDVSIHVRHGEKSSEMALVYGNDMMGAVNVIKTLKNKDRLNIFVSSEDPAIIEWFKRYSGHSITYFDFQLENFYPKQYTSLASVLVPQMLANMKHSIFADYVIGTIGSNWHRLLIELRMTTAGKANNYYFEVGDHICLSVQHCLMTNRTFHMNW